MKVLIALAVLVAAAAALPAAPKVPLPANRITNGHLATLGQFPHQVALHLIFNNNAEQWCGGSIISNTWILTAAHCTDGAVKADVYVGYTNLTSGIDAEPHHRILTIGPKNIYIPRGWNKKTWTNDISLVKLPVPIEFNEHVKTISLPKKTETSTFVNSTCVASGWGRTSDANQFMSTDLHWLEGPIIDNALCKQYFSFIKPIHLCLGTSNTHISPCNGDSGGPLSVRGTNTIIGVTSFGSTAGCEIGYPGVYTRVTSFLNWIEKVSGVQ